MLGGASHLELNVLLFCCALETTLFTAFLTRKVLKPEGEARQKHLKVLVRTAWGSGQSPSWMEA